MPDIGRLFVTLSRLYGTLVLRVYGAVFVALGALFLFWGGRGLLAYSRGVRAAWTEPGVCVLGLVAGPFIAWFGWRMMRDSPRRNTPLFSQGTLLGISLTALCGAVLVFGLMGTDGIQFALLASIVGAAGLGRWWSRRGGRGQVQDTKNTFFETVADLEDQDPAEAQRLIDSYFATEAQRETNRRAELWSQAPTDRVAAKRLRSLLQQDLEVIDQALREWEKTGDLTPDIRADLTRHIAQTKADLQRVNSYLGGLG